MIVYIERAHGKPERVKMTLAEAVAAFEADETMRGVWGLRSEGTPPEAPRCCYGSAGE